MGLKITDYDFAGWATKANLLCSDGRVIRKDAFMHNDGKKVPLVWNHMHNKPEEVLGHALLENREEGVYAYCYFNDTDSAQSAKLCVQHGDINQLSIYANKLKHQGSNVIHGEIREVSLVLAGANPGAYIESVMMHGDDSCEEGSIFTGEDLEYVAPLVHADDSKKGDDEVAEDTKKPETENESKETVMDVFNTLNDEQKKAVYVIIGQAIEDVSNEKSEDSEKEVKHSDDEPEIEEEADVEEEADNDEEIEHADGAETVIDVFNTLDDKQKRAVYSLIGQALEEEKESAVEHSEGGDDNMKTNVFDQETNVQGEVLSHSEIQAIWDDAKRIGSLREAVLQHGIEELDVMFPDNKAVNNVPEYIKRNDDWVAKVLGGVHHGPFARIKTIFADVTGEQARAKGYAKGNLKVEEVFKLLKRITNPTTVYKKQKLDRDDIIDTTTFDIIPWLKGELRMMLEEELARAFLIGDGRDPVDEADDKIDEECIRPIWKMEDLFTVKHAIELAGTETAEEKAKAFINGCVKSRKNYQGSGNPTMFISEELLTDCLLIEDTNGRVIYDTVEKLAARLRVKEIVSVPVMENQTRTADSKNYLLGGIYVNLKDYNVGTDKGGAVTMFDDFDIDYNQYKYLMETRCSGSLVKPHSAVAIEFVTK